MALNARQRAAYQHRCNIWSVDRTVDGNGKPGAETYALIASSVPCLYQYTPNVDDPEAGVGRIKRMTIITTDIVHMEASQPVADGYILKNVTSGHPSSGEFHRVLGAPRVLANAGNRKANKKSVMAMSMEHPPAGVS